MILIWNMMWIYIFVNDCPINIFVCSNHMVLMLLPFQGEFFLCPITQGAATLYPGLCASALTAHAGCNVWDGAHAKCRMYLFVYRVSSSPLPLERGRG